MSITIAPPPPGGEEAVRGGINSLLDVYPDVRSNMADTTGGYTGVEVAAPHPVYTAGLDDLLAGTLLSSARLCGWRYILLGTGSDNPLAAAEVRLAAGEPEEAAGARFSALNTGPFVESTVRGVAVAEGLEQVRESDYELRLLHLPSLYVVAVWLHGGEGRDIFIPLAPAPHALKPFAVYSAGKLAEALRELAEARRGRDEGLLPPDDQPRAEAFGFTADSLGAVAAAQDTRATLERIELLELLPEDERTAYYDTVVAPLVAEFAAGVRADDDETVFRWLQIQASTLDWAVEGISDVTYELNRRAPETVEAALARLHPAQQVRVRWLLNEFQGEENLPAAVVARAAALTADLPTPVAADATPSQTRVFAEFRGTDTFRSSRGFPVFRGTLRLFTPGGDVVATFNCNNGGGAPNFRMRNGPLPPGVYRVSNHRPNRTTQGMVHEGVGYSFDLSPTDGTQVFGRSLFRIHPDANPLGTNGCIGVREDAARLRDCEERIVRLLRDVGPFKIAVRF